MQSTPPRKKSHVALIVFSVLILLLACLGFIIAKYSEPFIEQKLSEKLPAIVKEQTKGLYELKFDSIKVNLIAGSLKLRGVEVRCTADSAQIAAMDSVNFILHHASLQSIEIKHLDYFRLLNKTLHFGKIRLADGDVEVSVLDTIPAQKPSEINAYDSLRQYLKRVSIADIDVLNIGFRLHDKTKLPNEVSAHLSGLYLHHLVVDDETINDSSLVAFSRSVAADVTAINIPNLDNFYRLSLDSASFSSKDKEIELFNMAYTSLYGEMLFSKKAGRRTTSMNLHIPFIDITGVHLPALLHNSAFVSDSIFVHRMDFSAFIDNSVPLSKRDTLPVTPQDAIRSVPIPLYIGKVEMKDGRITYGEYGIQSEQKGYAHMLHSDGKISNITNIPDSLKKNHWMKANFTSMLEGQVKGGAQMEFDLTAPKSNFTFKAFSAPMRMDLMNDVSYAWSLAKVTSGKLNGVILELKGTATNIKGRLGLNYTDLQVELYKRKKNGEIKRWDFVTNAANNLVITDDNTGDNNSLRVAQIDYSRWPGDAYHSYLMGAVIQGIQLNIGIAKSIQKQVQAGMRKANMKTLAERKKLKGKK